MNLADRIKEIIAECGVSFVEKPRTIYTTCPLCGRSDKFSILKENGACICYRASCEFGRRWFVDWIMLTANVDRVTAKLMLYNNNTSSKGLYIQFDEKNNQKQDELKPITFPDLSMVSIDSPEAIDGANYLKSRGIPVEIAVHYSIYYSPLLRRVIFPVIMDGKVYGYQARHIDNVDSAQKVRNNEGFRRDSLVMFYDRIELNGHVIITEGPIDALKFHFVGGNICTMGKVVTDKQIDLILEKNPAKIYLALDEDADKEMNELRYKFSGKELYWIRLPKSVKERCAGVNKKADFGECTFLECSEAFKNAIKLDPLSLIFSIS
jgi:hypothetical protein